MNPEHLEILEQGADAWNKWRKDNPEISPDLHSAWLDKKDLRRFNFNNTDLRKARLSLVNFYLATLVEADLSEADLQAADLRGANLRGANLCRSRINGAIFDRTVLDEADFRESFINLTIFGDCDLSSVKGLESVIAGASSTIGTNTIFRSQGKIPEAFLRNCGVPETFITFAKSLLNSTIEFYSCLIIYSSKDEEFAHRIHADLQELGIRAWFAPESLMVGDRFMGEIDSAIRVHDKLILVLSEKSIHSNWVHSEVRKAVEIERETQRTILFPIRIDDSVVNSLSHLPVDLTERQIFDFSQWRDRGKYKHVMSRLAKALTVTAATEMTEGER